MKSIPSTTLPFAVYVSNKLFESKSGLSLQWEGRAPQLEKSLCSKKDQAQSKIKKNNDNNNKSDLYLYRLNHPGLGFARCWVLHLPFFFFFKLHMYMWKWLRSVQLSPWNSPGQNTEVGILSLLQGIFLSQESNWDLLHCRQILYLLSYQRSPFLAKQILKPFM